MTWFIRVRTIALALGLALAMVGPELVPAEAQAQEREALLIPGKRTLRQRVIIRPGANLFAEPGAAVGGRVLPFTVFYVYGRRPTGRLTDWLEVGRSSRGAAEGWVRAVDAIEWRQNLTLAFYPRSRRQPVMFLRERSDLFPLLNDRDLVARLRESARNPGGDGPLVAVEPDTFIDINRQFYLLPILQAENATTQTGDDTTVMEVASIALPSANPQPTPEERARALANFNVGIAFVVDTSLSMDPYIERVRQAIRQTITRIRGTPAGERFRFAMIGFRNSLQAAPRLEYVARRFASFEDFRDFDRFITQIGQMRATRVDSGNFDEDALAGVQLAVDDLKWEDYGGRYIILVTDAGARDGGDPLSQTRLDPAGMRELTRARGIAVYALHLLTPSGAAANNHARARQQYQVLSEWPEVGALYYPVERGALDDFSGQVNALTDHLLQQLARAGGAGVRPPTQPGRPAPPRMATQTADVGEAMILRYLGRTLNTAAPSFYRAWAIDRDLETPARTALEVRVLLNRNQLSNLYDRLNEVRRIGEMSRRGAGLTPRQFFDELRLAIATSIRDPALADDIRSAQNVGALLGEFLEGLPYRSRILGITHDRWIGMSASQQREILNEIEDKLRSYREYNSSPHLWHLLGSTVAGDAVYPVPLDRLP